MSAQSKYRRLAPVQATDGTLVLNADLLTDCNVARTWDDYWTFLGQLETATGVVNASARAAIGAVDVKATPAKTVGAWYYPGWKNDPNHPFGPPWDKPWWWLAQFPERMPLQGAYDETQQSVMDTAMRHAIAGGVDCFWFNWYYEGVNRRPAGDHAIKNFMTSTVPGIKFVAAFESETSIPPVTSLADWHAVIDEFAVMFNHPKYLHVDGRPVLPVVKLEHMHQTVALRAGVTHKQLLDIARTRTGKNIYFIACGHATSHWKWTAEVAGYNGYSQYNLMNTWTNRDLATAGPASRSFADLDDNYRREWAHQAAALNMDFWLPLTAGFDARPWARLNIGIATEAELRAHLQAGKAVMESSAKCRGGVLYAWNEWGEGGFIEPDKANKQRKLEVFRSVFKPHVL